MKKLIGTIFLISLVIGCIQEEQESTPPKTLSQSIDLPKEVEFLGSYEIEKAEKLWEKIKELTRRLYDKRESYIQIKVMFDTDFIVI